MTPPRLRTVVIAWAILVAALLCCGVQITAQTGVTLVYPDYAAYVHDGVPDINIGVPKTNPAQRTTRAVDGCGLGATNTTQVCFTVAAVDPTMNQPLLHVWVNCNGTARETGEVGQFTFKATKGKLYKCRVDLPRGYGGRPAEAAGEAYQYWITPIQVRNDSARKHVLVLLEMQPTKPVIAR